VSIRENASLLCMSRVRRRGYRISRSSETNLVESILETNGVLGAAPEYDLQQLSGGNQQKLILGKWLITNPRVLLLDEPTHGMDVGACEGVFTQIRTACRAGISIMIASSDADVLAELCNRVAIMRHGRIVRTLVGADVTESNIASGIG
jgi:ribose transport system ATP-binding protein